MLYPLVATRIQIPISDFVCGVCVCMCVCVYVCVCPTYLVTKPHASTRLAEMRSSLNTCVVRMCLDPTWIKPPRTRFKNISVMCAGELPHSVETSEGLYRFQVAINHTGDSLTVLSDPGHRFGYCIGNQLWTSAEEVVRYLARFPDAYFQGKRVLELGAGLGLPGQVGEHDL